MIVDVGGQRFVFELFRALDLFEPFFNIALVLDARLRRLLDARRKALERPEFRLDIKEGNAAPN